MSRGLVIGNANVVDGTGAQPFAADIAVDGDAISAIGKVADTNAVTPGVIDLHTHLDAHIGWDPMLTSVTWHGVTTVLLNNRGATFAPCKPADREFLAGMMEIMQTVMNFRKPDKEIYLIGEEAS